MSGLVAHCIELLSPLGAVRARAMFGGHGLYVDEVFIALIAFDKLYLKVNEQTQPQFAAAGCQPFVYDGKGKAVTMSYWTAPAEALDSPELMRPWARMALQAALQARAAAPPRPVKTRTAVPAATPAAKRRAARATKPRG